MTQTDNATRSPIAPFTAPGVKGYPTFMAEQTSPIGKALPVEAAPQNAKLPKLFEPITVRGVEFPNRLWVAPMCQYSSDNGKATDYHFIHYGSMAMRGWGSVMIEATAVVPEGRITPNDSGLWEDSQIEGFKRIVDYAHANKTKIGIQIAHAGRKASTLTPWVYLNAMRDGYTGGEVVSKENGGWPEGTYAPSPVSFHEGYQANPNEASLEYLENLKEAYRQTVRRCKEAGFDFIEIHGAHGYFMHEFTSPLSNFRTDKYGGCLENRLRLPVEIATLVRKEWDGPLFYRMSASDWLDDIEGAEKQFPGEKEEYKWWGIEQTTILAQKLKDAGVDLLDVSSGGNDHRTKYRVFAGYQVPFADHVRKHVKGLLVGAVGLITSGKEAEDILDKGAADVIFIGREALRNIDLPTEAARELDCGVAHAVQYHYAVTARRKPAQITE